MTYRLEPDPATYTEWDILLQTHEIGFQTTNRDAAGLYPFVLIIEPKEGVSVGMSLNIPFEINLIDLCKDTTFAPFKLPDMEIFRQDFSKFVNDQANSFNKLTTYAALAGADCGLIYFDLQSTEQGVQRPDWIWLEEDMREVVVDYDNTGHFTFSKQYKLSA